MRDKLSVDRLNKLHPKVRNTFKNFIEAAETRLNITLRITDGYRSIAQQDELYAQGRTKPGKIVTNSKGGQSYHNYGLAVDLVPMVGNKPDYNYDYEKIKEIAAEYGIAWGGDFKRLVDKPHFEKTLGYTVSQLSSITKDRYGLPLI